jgi:hypothetical protein
MSKNYSAYKLIIGLVVAVLITGFATASVYATECEDNYGGGETCLINKHFKITKQVRRSDSDSGDWKDKVRVDENFVTNDDKYIEFKITIKNLSDEEADKFDFDNMKMEDFLPKEMYRVGGDGLTEYFDDFGPGETKTFKIEARVKENEFDRDDNFDKCVVNKAQVKRNHDTEGSATATVCFGNITELPETGAPAVLPLVGLGFVSAGLLIKKKISA